MSLLTYADAKPWAESIRVELMAGHMPPWGIESAATRFRNLQSFPAREMNVLLTWASGGTPPGKSDAPETVPSTEPRWTLGMPDVTVPLREVTIGADEHVEEFAVPVTTRRVRAVDLLPGTPAVVRRATISVRSSLDQPLTGLAPERLLALWLPGDHPVALDSGYSFDLPEGAELLVRIYYKKTWQYERREMKDRSTVGLYAAAAPSVSVQMLRAAATGPAGAAATVPENTRAIAIYADEVSAEAPLTVRAIRPDGTREELIAFRPRTDWLRRYWFREPIALPRGTRIEVTAAPEADRLQPPAAPRTDVQPGTRLPTLALDVIRAN
jgi:hypothetical protein